MHKWDGNRIFYQAGFYPNPDKNNIANHVNHVVKLALVNIAQDVAIINAEN